MGTSMDPKWEGPHSVGYKWDDVLYEGVTSYRDGRGLYRGGSGLIQRWEGPHTEVGGVSHTMSSFLVCI